MRWYSIVMNGDLVGEWGLLVVVRVSVERLISFWGSFGLDGPAGWGGWSGCDFRVW